MLTTHMTFSFTRGRCSPAAMALMDLREIGRCVRTARGRARLTQAQLAEAAGVTDETISRVERGAYEPSLGTMLAVADALGASLDALLGRIVPSALSEVGAQYRRRPSSLVNRLQTRAQALTPAAQEVLLRVAKLMPNDSRPRPRK